MQQRRERELYSLQKREESEDTRELWDICPPEGGGGYVIGGQEHDGRLSASTFG